MLNKNTHSLEKQIGAVKKEAYKSYAIGGVGVTVGVGALAVAIVDACQGHWDVASISALTGVLSAVAGGMNLANSRILDAKLHCLRTKKNIEEMAVKSHEH